MAAMPYTEERGRFSQRGHKAAKEQVYPKLIGVPREDLEFSYPADRDTDQDSVYDRELNVDVRVHVEVSHLPRPMHLTFQERWRGTEYRHHQDVTVTEINQITGTNSEHYKISSGYHLYGYYDDVIERIPEAICFNVPTWQVGVIQDIFDTGAGQDKTSKSSFVAYKFDELKDSGCVLAHLDGGEIVYRGTKFPIGGDD